MSDQALDPGGRHAADYENYRGERAWRTILPGSIWYGATEHHPEPQWFLRALALDRDGERRDFAFAMIFHWRPVAPREER